MTLSKKITLCITVVLFAAYLVVSTGFVAARQQKLVCERLQVKVCDSVVNRFISPAEVVGIITKEVGAVVGERMPHLDLYKLEQLLNKRSVIRNTEVFTSIDGVLHVHIYQRRPVVRLQTPSFSCYIDETGYIFPLSGIYTSFVPVVTGNVPARLDNGYRGMIPAKENFLNQIYDFAMFLDEHDFWRLQIAQVHVKNTSEVVLVPREGREIIRLGTLDGYEYKLDKLNAFYRKVLVAGVNTPYSDIDLRYSNQIVCKKK